MKAEIKNVLSLFNGMSFGMMALESLGIIPDNYYSSEIDKYANQATAALYPEIIQVGDVTKWREWGLELGDIELLLAGFPCQAWSLAGKQEGDDDPRGALVHDLIAIWQEINKQRLAKGKEPVKFMFENVKMKKQFLDYINNLFGVTPLLIDSQLVSGGERARYYWSNSGVLCQPIDLNITGYSVIDHSKQKPNSDDWQRWWVKNGDFQLKKKYSSIINDNEKAITQTARQVASWNGNLVRNRDGSLRFFSAKEAARLQSVPEDKIQILLNAGISNTQLYKMLGNGWNMLTVKHVLSGLV